MQPHNQSADQVWETQFLALTVAKQQFSLSKKGCLEQEQNHTISPGNTYATSTE